MIAVIRLRFWWNISTVHSWCSNESHSALWPDETWWRSGRTGCGWCQRGGPKGSCSVSQSFGCFHLCMLHCYFSMPIFGLKWIDTTVMGRYGPAPKNSDSAINVLLDVVRDQSGKQYKMDHYATRFPTNVVDIARFLVRVSDVSGMSFSIFRL